MWHSSVYLDSSHLRANDPQPSSLAIKLLLCSLFVLPVSQFFGPHPQYDLSFACRQWQAPALSYLLNTEVEVMLGQK